MELTSRRETCDGKLQRHYYFKNATTRLVISCLRCGNFLSKIYNNTKKMLLKVNFLY